MGTFFGELKRRNVVRVAVAYIVVCWLVFQIGEILFEAFGAPDWVFKTVILLLAIGFPFALIFAWAFELTSEGIKKTRDVHVTASITTSTGRKLDFVIIAALIAALGYFLWERQQPSDSSATDVDSVAESGATEPPAESVDQDDEPRRSIAVIPFINMSSDKEQEWFVDGLTEEILNSLARTPDLLVAARTSSFTFKGSNENVQTIAASLGVDHILEGSVRRAGDRLRVTAQLVRAIDGFHLWSETYDRNVDDMIDIQEDVAIEIANAMNTAMDPEALAEMMSSGTSSVPAFEAYLQAIAVGDSTFATSDMYDFLNARVGYERAIELDPEFAKAYWRLSLFWLNQMTTTNIVAGITDLSPDQMSSHYEKAINNAIKYEKDSISKIHYTASKARSELRFRRALHLNSDYLKQRPNDQSAHILQLILLSELGMYDTIPEAVADFYERDGYDQIVTVQSIQQLQYSGDTGALEEFVARALDRFGDNPNVLYQAHRALLWLGDIDGASKVVPIIHSSYMPDDSNFLVSLRQLCAENRVADADRLLANSTEILEDNPSISWLAHRILGNDEEAFEVLAEYDDMNDIRTMQSFLSYRIFDAGLYPNLMAILEPQGIDRGEVIEVPYQCQR